MKTAKPNSAPVIFTTYDIGRMTGTDPTTVHKWIDKGLLRGYRTPGGHRRVRAEDLRSFLDAHQMPVPKELGGAQALRVLLVDEDADATKSLTRSLRKLRSDWEVAVAASGIEALMMVSANAPDVLVFDLGMSEVDGLEVCKHLRQRPQTAAVKLVAMSGRNVPVALAKKALGAGACRCLKKPTTAADLVVAVEEAAGLRLAEA